MGSSGLSGRLDGRKPDSLPPGDGACREVYCTGWTGDPFLWRGQPIGIVPLPGLRAWLHAMRRRVLVLLLGGEALRALRPRSFRRWAPLSRVRAVAVPEPGDFAAALLWHEKAGVDSVARTGLAEGLEREVRVPVRVPLPPSSWGPWDPPEDPLLYRILECIPLLGDLSPGGLALHLGEGTRTVHEACTSGLAMKTADLLWEYRRVYTAHRRAAGMGVRVVGLELGYGTAGDFRRAFRKRGLRIPGAGKPVQESTGVLPNSPLAGEKGPVYPPYRRGRRTGRRAARTGQR